MHCVGDQEIVDSVCRDIETVYTTNDFLQRDGDLGFLVLSCTVQLSTVFSGGCCFLSPVMITMGRLICFCNVACITAKF